MGLHIGMCVECVMSFVWALSMCCHCAHCRKFVSCNDVTVYTWLMGCHCNEQCVYG